MSINIIKKLRNDEIKKELYKYNIKHLWLFGSQSKWTQTEDSDIDLLYECDREKESQWWGIISAKVFLENLFWRECDMVSIDNLHSLISKEVLATKKEIW